MNPNNASKNIYRLPFDGRVIRPEPQPAPFHYEESWRKHAVDFAMPEGTAIKAILDGRVIEAIDKYGPGRFDKSFLRKGNVIIIEHKNNEYSIYAHLRRGLRIRKGELVRRGLVIGYSGNSGFASYFHLHFDIRKKEGKDKWITLPIRFQIGKKIKILRSSRK